MILSPDNEFKSVTLCFTGHRPHKLPQGRTEQNILKSLLYRKIDEYIKMGYRYFITGCAAGIDTWAASIVTEFSRENPEVRLVCAMPFRDSVKALRGEWLWNMNNALETAYETDYVSEERERSCYRRRNEAMVNASSALIAVACEKASGAGQTIRYAYSRGLRISVIDSSLGSKGTDYFLGKTAKRKAEFPR